MPGSCCDTPEPTRLRVECHGGSWVVMADCRSCGSVRRESQYHAREITAKAQLDELLASYQRASWRS